MKLDAGNDFICAPGTSRLTVSSAGPLEFLPGRPAKSAWLHSGHPRARHHPAVGVGMATQAAPPGGNDLLDDPDYPPSRCAASPRMELYRLRVQPRLQLGRSVQP